MLENLNHTLNRLMPLITPTSVLIGFLFANSFHSYSFVVPWVFAFMTFSGSLGSGLKDFFQVFRRPLPLVTPLLILHIVMPLVSWVIGNLFFSNDPLIVTGMILAMSIPTGISSMIWVSIYKGSMPITISLILIDTFLSPLTVPYSLILLVGSKVNMNVWGLVSGLLLMVVLPSLTGMLLNQLSSGRAKAWGVKLSPFSKIGTVVVIVINGAVVAPYLKTFNWNIVSIIVVMLIISSLGYLLGWMSAKVQKLSREMTFSVVFNSGMRNTVAGVALASSYFPPAVSIPVIIGTIFQQLLASIWGFLINKTHSKKTQQQDRKKDSIIS